MLLITNRLGATKALSDFMDVQPLRGVTKQIQDFLMDGTKARLFRFFQLAPLHDSLDSLAIKADSLGVESTVDGGQDQ